MCNFTHMETTPAALPVPPLSEEQAPHFKQLMPERMAELEAVLLSHERRMGIKNNVEHLRDYGGMAAGDYRSHVPALLAHIEAQAEFASHYLAQRDLAKAENARLSLLLEEERRTGGELRGKVTSLLEDLANGCVPVKMGPGVTITPYWRGVNTERANGLAWAELKCKELGIEWPIKPIPYQGDLPSEPAPTCQRDCQKCGSRSVIDQSPEIIGFYETSGLPVREGDDYVTDVEGCYLTRAEADELAQEAAAGGAGVGLQGEPAVVDPATVWDDYCERCGTPEREKDDYEGCCGLCGEGVFKAMPKSEADALEAKFEEWVEAENARRDTKNKVGGLQGEEDEPACIHCGRPAVGMCHHCERPADG